MSKVIVDKQKIDLLANAISAKSGETLTMTLDEMVEAVDGIEEGTAEPVLQTKSVSFTATTAQERGTVRADSGYDGLEEVDVIITPIPMADINASIEDYFTTVNNSRKWVVSAKAYVEEAGWVNEGGLSPQDYTYSAIPTNTTITPTESSQTIGGSDYMMEGAVTVNAIPSNYVGSGITQRSSTDLSASGATVTVPAGYYSSQASKAVSNGSATAPATISGTSATLTTGTNTLTLSKTVSVTPSVTAGYVSSGTAGNASVSLTASVNTRSSSDLTASTLTVTAPSGYYASNATKTLTDANLTAGNIKKDVSIFGVTGTYEGGGSDIAEAQTEIELETNSSTLTFTGLAGEPTSFVVLNEDGMYDGMSVPSGTPYKAVMVVYDGTDVHAQTLTNTSNAQATYDGSNFSQSYSSGTLTITSTGAQFSPGFWIMSYTYGGTGGNIQTADVQVGSGATSITFTGLDDEPLCWSCIFKSNFGTSSGYQRVIGVRKREASGEVSIDGFCLDSSAHGAGDNNYWTESYNNGSLTITSSGTNAGGYFHQPGYYQLTYGISGDQSLQTKTVTPTEQTQNVTADTAQGYTALKKVVVNPIPSSYVQPTSTVGATTYRASTSNQTINAGTYHSAAATIAAVSQTNLEAGNIKSGTTISISNGQSNIWSVTGTYTGGGGGSASIDTKTVTASNYPVSISFTSMKGEPKAFFLRSTSQISSSGSTTYYYIIDLVYDGNSNNYCNGNCFRIGSTRRVDPITTSSSGGVVTGYTWSYSGTTLTITTSAASRSASPGSFNNGYQLVYVY